LGRSSARACRADWHSTLSRAVAHLSSQRTAGQQRGLLQKSEHTCGQRGSAPSPSVRVSHGSPPALVPLAASGRGIVLYAGELASSTPRTCPDYLAFRPECRCESAPVLLTRVRVLINQCVLYHAQRHGKGCRAESLPLVAQDPPSTPTMRARSSTQAAVAARHPFRLSDELALMVVECPDRLPDEREQTLAALCRLARRFRANAERVLYSRVDLSSSWDGSVMRTLYERPELRPLVKAVDLTFAHSDLDDRVEQVLRELPNLQELSLRAPDPTAQGVLLSAPGPPIRRLRLVHPWDDVRPLLSRYPERLVGVRVLHIANIGGDAVQPPRPIELPKLALLSTSIPCDWPTFSSSSSLFRMSLTSLTLPLSRELGAYDLHAFTALRTLRLCDTYRAGYGSCRPPSAADLVAVFGTCRQVTSLGLEGDLSRASSKKSDPSFAAALAALPPGLEHLALLARTWAGPSCAGLADAVAAYVTGEARSPALRTLRLGGGQGAVAERFRALKVRQSDGQDDERVSLSAWLSEVGVEVTTVDGGSWQVTETSR